MLNSRKPQLLPSVQPTCLSPFFRPSAPLPHRPQLPAGHRANSAIFFLCAPLSYKKMLQCAANVCLYNGSVHKKGARSKNYKIRSRGKGKMYNNNSSNGNNTGWDCSDIAGSAQHKRKNRKTFTTYKTLFTHRHRHTDTSRLCIRVCVCVCGLVYFFVYIFDCFARAFAISFAATLASAAALWVSVVQLLQAIPRSLTARQRRTGQIRGLKAHTHTHTWTSWQIWQGAVLVLTSLNCCCLRCVCVLCVQLKL